VKHDHLFLKVEYVLDNKVLRKIFAPKRDEVSGEFKEIT
jgi:hypothetical protein